MHLLVENELKKIKTFDSSYLRGKNQFEEDGTQYYLVFQPVYKRLVTLIMFQNGNLQDCLMKLLNLLIIHLLQN